MKVSIFIFFLVLAVSCRSGQNFASKNSNFSIRAEGMTDDGLVLILGSFPERWLNEEVWWVRDGSAINIEFSPSKPVGSYRKSGVSKKIDDSGNLKIVLSSRFFEEGVVNIILAGKDIGAWEIEGAY